MSVSIYAYRTLLWMSDQQQEVIPAGAIPQEILPPDELKATHQEMLRHGWLVNVVQRLAGGPDFRLSTEGHRQARRWAARYAVYSAAYEILAAIPQDQYGYLLGAEDAFVGSSPDPILVRPFSEQEINKGADLLHQQQHIRGSESHGEPLSRLEITPHGEDVRDEHYVPGLRVGSSAAETAPKTEFHTSISGGTFGSAQFGHHNTANVGNVSSEINQHFQELREMTESSKLSEEEREELLGQIAQLEAVAQTGDAKEFETLKYSFLSGFGTALGDKAIALLLAISPLIVALGG